MQIHCLQLNIAWENKPANFARTRHLLAQTPIQPGSLLLLPEMFATGFSMNVDAIAEPPDGPTTQFLAALARQYQITLIAGLVRKSPSGKGENHALVLAPDGSPIADYAKLHPFSFGTESQHYTAGQKLLTFPWQTATVAPTICYDLRFPELYRHATRAGATLLAVIANWPSAREHHWVTLLQARAIENQCYVAAVNRTGSDPANPYPGRSLIIDPRGAILADAGPAETLISATIDLPALHTYRQHFPALADIRPDLLPPLPS